MSRQRLTPWLSSQVFWTQHEQLWRWIYCILPGLVHECVMLGEEKMCETITNDALWSQMPLAPVKEKVLLLGSVLVNAFTPGGGWGEENVCPEESNDRMICLH